VLRSDGSPTYYAADLAYVEHKFSRGHDRLIYVLGADHHGYVGRLKAAVGVMGYDPDAVEVPLYQMVTVSGERMGKRRGLVVAADELIDAIGADAARFFLVQRSHDQVLDIDLDLAVRHERENPVYYVQYAHARCASILRKAESELGLVPAGGPWQHVPAPQETELVKRLAEWPTVAAEAAERRAPHRVVAWLQALAGEYHVFQHDVPVLRAEPDARAFRLALVSSVKTTISTALGLIAVEAPAEM
jgi:arginyl-tRNA synthetase